MNKHTQSTLTTLVVTLALGLGSLATQADSGMENTTVSKQKKPLSGQPAAADRHRVERRLAVRFADLNLDRPAGLDTLYLRLEQATALVCGPRETGRNLALHRDQNQCRKTAMDRAVSDIAHLGLHDLHLARTGRAVGRGAEIAGR